MLVEVRVQSLGLDRASRTPILVLKELEGERVLPIWIGPGEASAIAMELARMKVSRPLTHDLLVSVVEGMGGALERVVIHRVCDATYYAELQIRRTGDLIAVDARPSDSVAVALRSDARIFAEEALLECVTVEVLPEEGGVAASQGQDSEGGTAGAERPMSPAELQAYLRGLRPEDFGRFNP